MRKSYKSLCCLEDRLNRNDTERTLKIQLLIEFEAGIPYFQVTVVDPDRLVSESMETVFHWRGIVDVDFVMTKMEWVGRDNAASMELACA